MPSISELLTLQADAVAKRHAMSTTATTAELQSRADAIKKIQHKIIETIRDGAAPCKHCQQLPHAMARVREVPMGENKKIPVTLYEVGCLVCPGPAHRVQDVTPEAAVAQWNTKQK